VCLAFQPLPCRIHVCICFFLVEYCCDPCEIITVQEILTFFTQYFEFVDFCYFSSDHDEFYLRKDRATFTWHERRCASSRYFYVHNFLSSAPLSFYYCTKIRFPCCVTRVELNSDGNKGQSWHCSTLSLTCAHSSRANQMDLLSTCGSRFPDSPRHHGDLSY
jgi:hypothetical protein